MNRAAMRTSGLVSALCCGAIVCAGAHAQVELRANGGVVGTSVRQVGDAGVRIETGGQEQLVGWDRVKTILGTHAAEAKAFADVSDRAWRARARLERGDFAAAEPLLESLFATYQSLTGPTAAFVSEGLLSCRLARGVQTAAITPWLASLGADASDIRRDAWIGVQTPGTSIVDREYLLSPALPPVWVSGPALESLVRSTSWESLTKSQGVAGQMAKLYQKGARLYAGVDSGSLARDFIQPEGPGARLVFDMLLSWHGDVAVRKTARDELTARLPTDTARGGRPAPRWVEAWTRFAIGRSMLREDDEHTRLLGVIQLLHVPVRFGLEQPYLAGMALGDAVAALAELHDAHGASVLKHELVAKFPRHPILEWDLVRKVEKKTPDQGPQE